MRYLRVFFFSTELRFGIRVNIIILLKYSNRFVKARGIIGITMGFSGIKIQIVGNVIQCRHRRRNVIMSARAKTQFGVLLYTARRRSLHGRATITTDGCRGVVVKVAADVSGVRRYTDAFIEWNYNNLRRRNRVKLFGARYKPSYTEKIVYDDILCIHYIGQVRVTRARIMYYYDTSLIRQKHNIIIIIMTFIIPYIIILNRELRRFPPPLRDSRTTRLHIGR